MKIKKVSTEQFAGIHDKEVEFCDGINVVYGKNESGKSTLVNLISRTFFQDADLGKSDKNDKEFVNRYFPVGAKSDFIQGKIVFEAENGEYSITKEWIAPDKKTKENPSTCKLSTPDGKIKNQNEINAELKNILKYGEGVYSEMLLSSQYNTDISLQNILDTSESKPKSKPNTKTGKTDDKINAKEELADFVTKAFYESDGVSAEKIAAEINKKITELKGSYWDAENNRPTRSERMKVNLGAVLPRYYDFVKAENNLKKMEELEGAAEKASAHFRECDAEYNRLKEEYKNFSKYEGILRALDHSKKLKKTLLEQIEKYGSVAADWLKRANDFEKATGLKDELENRKILDKYQKVKTLRDEFEGAKAFLLKIKNPSSEEIGKAEKAKNKNSLLENSLCGMNLSAAIKMFGGNEIEITYVKNGEKIDISKGNCEIKEAVKITVPGIMEMQLSPIGVDVAAVKDEIAGNNSIISGIFEKYEASSTEDLRKLQRSFDEANKNFETAKEKLENALCEETFDELEAKAAALPEEIRSKEEIENDILSLCGNSSIERFINMNEAVLNGYTRDYVSAEKLNEEKTEKETELSKAEKDIEMATNIPEEYSDIDKLEELGEKVEQSEKDRENARDAKKDADGELNNFYNEYPDPVSAFEEAERVFNEQKELLAHWIHIEEIFNKVRENFRNNPMHDLAESFTNYLGIISGERISSEFPDEEKLEMEIYSGKNKLDYEKLSEGTKETVSLAFRLAVLDHLFPGGGGVIVFDDPFTDMDADRAAKSCELIKECAKKHQVIFLTCNEAYKEILEGKIINI